MNTNYVGGVLILFILNFRFRRERWIAGGLIVCMALAVGFGIFRYRSSAVTASAIRRGVRTNEDRIAYLADLGWTVEGEPVSVEPLHIPKEPDETYESYFALQSGQGFDLSRYRGRTVTRYTYHLLDYPTGETNVLANLLVCRNTVVGGEILCPDLHGFLHGLIPSR